MTEMAYKGANGRNGENQALQRQCYTKLWIGVEVDE